MISFVSCSNDEDVVGSQKKDPIHIEKYQISQADARNYVLDDVLNSNVFAETKSSGDYYISSDSVTYTGSSYKIGIVSFSTCICF